MIEINDSSIDEKLLKNKNFPVKVNDNVYWVSRSVAVCVFVFKKNGDDLCVLSEIRGEGSADFHGMYCVPCGYMDYNENLNECAIRELKEETGFNGDTEKLIFININSSPYQNRQNISINFAYFASENEDFDLYKAEGGEPDEVSKVEWITCATIRKKSFFKKFFSKNKKNYIKLNYNFFNSGDKWAFNHHKRIINILSSFYDIKK